MISGFHSERITRLPVRYLWQKFDAKSFENQELVDNLGTEHNAPGRNNDVNNNGSQ